MSNRMLANLQHRSNICFIMHHERSPRMQILQMARRNANYRELVSRTEKISTEARHAKKSTSSEIALRYSASKADAAFQLAG